jgi:hypothetical protein
VLDYVAERLDGVDPVIAERLLEGVVDRLRGLHDPALVKRLIAAGDEAALERLGGVAGARDLIVLIDKMGREGTP